MIMRHTVRSFDKDLKFLEAKIAFMGGHAERMIADAIHAVVHNDLALAKKVVAADKELDYAELEIDEKAISIIAMRQPMAVDLREIIGAIRISGDLERVGDMGKNIAKRVAVISEIRLPESFYRGLEAFAVLALEQLKEVLDGYASRSPERIKSVLDRDNEIDAMYSSLYLELLVYMTEEPRYIPSCTHLLFCAKNIERIGDHATNIAETLYYILTGEYLEDERPRDDTTHKVNNDMIAES